MSRRKARESALQMLFQLDVGKNEWQEAEKTLTAAKLSESNQEFVRSLVKKASEELAALDALINKYSLGWDVERLANVDKNILRLAVCELQQGRNSHRIIINEAIELAKIFGGEGSGSFINAVLDNIYVKEISPSGQEDYSFCTEEEI